MWRQYLSLYRLVSGKLGRRTEKFTAVEYTGQRQWEILYPVGKTLRAVIRDHLTVAQLYAKNRIK